MNVPVLPPPDRPAPASAAPPRVRGYGHTVALTALTAVAAGVYAAYGLIRLHTFRAGTYDLVIFDQAVRGYASLRPPTSLAKGVHNGFGPEFLVLGDHWSPILATLAPLYWVHDGPATLIVAQAVLMALAIPTLWVFARRALGATPAYLTVVGYALSWPVAEAVAFDFHEVAFVPVLTAVLLERFQAGRRWQGVAAAGALLLVKEDMGLLVAGYGCYLLLAGRSAGVARARAFGAAFVVAGIAATYLAMRVLIPAFGGDGDYYWAYAHLGDGVPQALATALRDPLETLRLAVSPGVKLHTLAWLGLPLLFLPLASPLVVAALPLLAERMLAADFPNWWGTAYHYNAFLVVVLFAAGVDGALRLDRAVRALAPRLGRRAAGLAARFDVPRGWAVGVLAAAVLSVPNFAFGQSLDPDWYERTERMRAAAAAVDVVPDGATVEAANTVGPHLSPRTRVLLWDRTPRWAPWVVADVGERMFPFEDVTEQRERAEMLRARGYRTVFSRDGYLVLHRDRPSGGPLR